MIVTCFSHAKIASDDWHLESNQGHQLRSLSSNTLTTGPWNHLSDLLPTLSLPIPILLTLLSHHTPQKSFVLMFEIDVKMNMCRCVYIFAL